jgi:hypothetical protein
MDKKTMMALGGIVVIGGIALIIISPNLVFTRWVPGGSFGGGLVQRTDLSGVTLLAGVALLVIGGIVAALGFAGKDKGADLQNQEGIRLYHAGQQHGPYPMHSIVEWHKSGKLSEDDLVRPQGSNEWIPVTKFLGASNPSPTSKREEGEKE